MNAIHSFESFLSLRPSWLLAVATTLGLAGVPAQAWEPTAPVELVVPAGTGGGADQMARFIQEMVKKHNLMAQPLTVVNKSGNSGAEGLLDVKAAQGNPHKLIITLSNLFTTPLATGTKFTWQDITPVQMLALDQFVLWVNAKSPHQSAKDVLDAMRAAPPGSIKLGGTGSKQEDQLISVLLETAGATRLTYVPLKGGGDVAALAGRATSTSPSTTRSKPRSCGARARAAAVRVRRRPPRLPREDRRPDELERPADLHVVRHPGAVPDDARHLHVARRHARAGGVLPAAAGQGACAARVEGFMAQGAFKPNTIERRAVRAMARPQRRASTAC